MSCPRGRRASVACATARRVIANQRRSSRRQAALYERLAVDGAPVVQEPPSADREETLVHEALGRLRQRDREVLLLAEWEGLSPAQIAAVMACPAITARGRLHRAKASVPHGLRGPARPRRRRPAEARGAGDVDDLRPRPAAS